MIALSLWAIVAVSCMPVQNVINTSNLSVPEEGGRNFVKITDETIEQITNPNVYRDNHSRLRWWANPLICISKDGNFIAYNVYKNERRNIFIKSLNEKGASIQRTFRSKVNDVAISPDAETICFSEIDGNNSYLYITSAKQGTVVQRISPQNVSDYAPAYSKDGSKIFFSRADRDNYSIWSYDLKTMALSNYCYGLTPFPISSDEFLCARQNSTGNHEIWAVNYKKGTESLLVSQDDHSFTTASLSPDGEWILMVSNTIPDGNSREENLDIYVVRSNGTNLTQLTYHKGHDCSPVWSKDGKSIYFLSQRGSQNGEYNIWKMNFDL